MSAKAIREYHGKRLVSKWIAEYGDYDIENRCAQVKCVPVRALEHLFEIPYVYISSGVQEVKSYMMLPEKQYLGTLTSLIRVVCFLVFLSLPQYADQG